MMIISNIIVGENMVVGARWDRLSISVTAGLLGFQADRRTTVNLITSLSMAPYFELDGLQQ